MGLEKKRGLMVALDQISFRDMYDFIIGTIALSTGEDNIVYKIGNSSLTYLNKDELEILVEYGNIVLDLKMAEVKDYVKPVVDKYRDLEIDGIITHGFIGKGAIEELVKQLEETNIDTIVVCDTSDTDSYYKDIVEEVAETAIEAGARGLVAPANKIVSVEKVSKIIKQKNSSVYLCSPGLFNQGGSFEDILELGVDYPIVGRKIGESENPIREVIECLDLLK
ncbi:MAG: orotidine 5'-phosphate decarboxylase / HUMPS family protein [Candidatus Aenigmatarchaeota archaeon]